jgi:hypothetical protein
VSDVSTVPAIELELGDFVNLHEDPVFDPECDGRYCTHLTQDAELIEAEPLPERRFRMTFQNQPGNDPEEGLMKYTGTVPWNYGFVDASR